MRIEDQYIDPKGEVVCVEVYVSGTIHKISYYRSPDPDGGGYTVEVAAHAPLELVKTTRGIARTVFACFDAGEAPWLIRYSGSEE